jgi:hypothetical protein
MTLNSAAQIFSAILFDSRSPLKEIYSSSFSFFQCCTEDELNESVSADALSFGYFFDLGKQVGVKPDKDGLALRFKDRHSFRLLFCFCRR